MASDDFGYAFDSLIQDLNLLNGAPHTAERLALVISEAIKEGVLSYKYIAEAEVLLPKKGLDGFDS